MFVDLDWPLNASSLLSASAELLVISSCYIYAPIVDNSALYWVSVHSFIAHGHFLQFSFYYAFTLQPSAWSFYRQDAAKRQTAGIKFTHRPKIRFFAPQGRLVAPIQINLGRADGHVGPLGCAKFRFNRQRQRGVGMRPQKYQKFPLFGKESPLRGDSLDRFRKFLRAFIRLTIVHSTAKFYCSSSAPRL